MMRTIFVVEDNKHILRTITKILSKIEGVEVRGFSSPTMALIEAQEKHPDLVVTDMMMPVMNGVELVRALRKEGVEAQVIFVTAYPDVTYKKLLPENRVRTVIEKPPPLQKIMEEVTAALGNGEDGKGETRVLRRAQA